MSQDSSMNTSPGPSPGSGSLGTASGSATNPDTEYELRILKRKVERIEEEKKKMQKVIDENEAKKKKAHFDDFWMEDETLHASVRRRLSYQHGKVAYKVTNTIKAIVAEVHLTDDVKKTMAEISGSKWPSTVAACQDYKTHGCTLAFSHDPRRPSKTGNNPLLLHVCILCLEFFSLACFYQGITIF